MVGVFSSVVERLGVASLSAAYSSAVNAEVEVSVLWVFEATFTRPRIGAFHDVCFWTELSLVLDLEGLLSCSASDLNHVPRKMHCP